MKRTALAAFACLLAITGCGGHSHPSKRPPPRTVRVCSGTTDTCRTLTISQLPKLTAPARGRIPDVSSYQGHPNWPAAKASGIAGAIVKAGEYTEDPDFAYNWAALRSLGVWHAPYLFVRSCSAAAFIRWLNSVGYPSDKTAGPPILDMEVPAASGCAPALTASLQAAFHRGVVIYTSPGTWAGGSHSGDPLWIATYGSSFAAIWQPVLAWQCTDGAVGCITYVPGIGYGDVSINLGLTKLVPIAPKPVDPYAIFPVKPVGEHATVEGWDKHGCTNPVKRQVCVALRKRLVFDRGRIWTLAHRSKTADWSRFHWGKREHLIIVRLEEKRR